jgi:hypothetical protein
MHVYSDEWPDVGVTVSDQFSSLRHTAAAQ